MATHSMLISMTKEASGDLERAGESALVRRAKKGDNEALALLYRHHAGAIHALAWRLTSDRILAQDITQEAFLRMLRHVSGIDPKLPVRPWLRRVTARLAIDRLRRSWRDLPEDFAPEPVTPESAPDQYGEALGLLRRLHPQARMLVWLNQMEGWTHRELGERFGQSESWSKSIVSRALSQLRDEVSKESKHHEE